jgi:hypothetical protein
MTNESIIFALQWDSAGELVWEDMEQVLADLCSVAQPGVESLPSLLASRECSPSA